MPEWEGQELVDGPLVVGVDAVVGGEDGAVAVDEDVGGQAPAAAGGAERRVGRRT